MKKIQIPRSRIPKWRMKHQEELSLSVEARIKNAPRIKDLGTRWTKMRWNFELFEEARRVFKIPALRTKRVRLQSSARPFLFLFWGDAKKEKMN